MCCECCKNPVSIILKIVAAVLLVYGLWIHSWTYIIIGAVICIIDCLLQCMKSKPMPEKMKAVRNVAPKPRRRR